MANTRPFTYNPSTEIEKNGQVGTLAYGPLNDVNGGENYDNNPGNRKWWMGPDEDNRYIIAKDVPAMNWPTQVPEGDIGSVRFWSTSTKSDTQFIAKVNSLPARSGETPFTTVAEAYEWVISNGYWTNYPIAPSIYAGWKTYRNPATTTQNGADIKYSPTQNTAYFNTELPTNFGTQYGNFYATNFASTISEGTTTDYQGDTTYLPTATQSFSGDDIGQGMMALDDAKDHLYVCTSVKFGVIKYDISDNTVLWSGPDPNTTQNIVGTISSQVKIQYESGSNKVIMYRGGDGRVLFIDAGDGEGLGYAQDGGSNVDDAEFVIPGPDNRALIIRDNTNNHKILNTDTQNVISTISLPSPYPSGGVFAAYTPIYVESKNKWYVPFRAAGNTTTVGYYENYIAVINGNGTFDKTIGFGRTYMGSGVSISHTWVFYDPDRDVLWAISPDGYMCAVNPDTGGTIIKTGRTYSQGQQYGEPVYYNNILITVAGPFGGSRFQSIDLSELYPTP